MLRDVRRRFSSLTVCSGHSSRCGVEVDARLEGCYVKVLHELIEESRIAEGDEICHAFACLNSQLRATS